MPTTGLGISSLGYGFLGGATTPGGNVKSYPYQPVAVEFLPRISIFQYPTAIPDPGSFTLSIWNWLPVGTQLYDLFEFGNPGQFGWTLFRVLTNAPNNLLEFELQIVGSGGTPSPIYVSPHCLPTGRWNHIYIVYRPSTGIDLWVNATFVINFVNSEGLGTLALNGYTIQFPDPFGTGGSLYSDFQCWFGTYIDPTQMLGVAMTPVDPQPPYDGKQVDTSLMQMLVDAMIAGGVDPLMMAKVYNVETQYGTVFDPTDSTHAGIFSFTQKEINDAGAVGSNFNNDASAQAFVFYNTVPGPDSWITPALNQFGSDPTGINRYMVYNQGSPVARAIWNASAGTTIGQIATQKNVPVSYLTGQSWARGGTQQHPNRWTTIDPSFNTALTGSDLISTWMDRLNQIWANVTADAESRITITNLTNLNAFISPTGKAVIPAFASTTFGQQSLLFTGKAAQYSTNLGTSGPFTLQGGQLIDYPLPPP